ncbi:MAG: glycosyltransferase [Bacteroidia bacterium]|nr:glycosyltransferase [Bacteroidia bacterium]MDW8235978.1 glycosyltransferase [Bacteroidia bacterium]
MSSVAIVLPTYNNLSELQTCLEALSQQTFRDFTAYVCVDGSTDLTLSYLEKHAPPFVVVLTHPDHRNHGRNATRNLVLPYLHRHRWLAFLDSDSIPLPHWLEAFMEANPSSREVLLGKILYYADLHPHAWSEYLSWREKVRARTVLDARHFITINAFIPAQAFVEIGGMDAQIRRHGLGDVEMGYRLEKAGYRFRYVPRAGVWSKTQPSLRQALLRLYDMAVHNLPYLYKKHPDLQYRLFGGKLLTARTWRWLLYLLLQPWIARRVLSLTERLPFPISRWLMRYLVVYAVARGLWGAKLSIPLSERERPLP